MSKRFQYSFNRPSQPVTIIEQGFSPNSYDYRADFVNDAVSNEMAVDGSVTPQEFRLRTSGSTNVLIERIELRLLAASISPITPSQVNRLTAAHPSPGLANGILIEYYRGEADGSQTKVSSLVALDQIKNVADMVTLSHRDGYIYSSPNGLPDYLTVSIDPLNIPLRHEFNDEVRVTIRDNLSTVEFTSFRAVGIGIQGEF